VSIRSRVADGTWPNGKKKKKMIYKDVSVRERSSIISLNSYLLSSMRLSKSEYRGPALPGRRLVNGGANRMAQGLKTQ